MNKEELIKLIENLNLPKDEYYILSSGVLVLYGLRDLAGDLDLCVSEELFNSLKEKYNIKEEDKNSCGFYKLNDLVEVVVENKKNFTRDFKDGYPVETLERILKFKKKVNRPKDQRDTIKLEEYLKNNCRKK